MTAEEVAVEPHFGIVIHGAEMEQSGLGRVLCGDKEFTAVPHQLMDALIVDAAGRALIGEGNADGLLQLQITAAVKSTGQRAVIVEIKLPFAVEGLVIGADKIRAGETALIDLHHLPILQKIFFIDQMLSQLCQISWTSSLSSSMSMSFCMLTSCSSFKET